MGSIPPVTQEQHLLDWPNAVGFQTLDEQREPVELRVEGAFPSATAGTLIRTGPSSHRTDNFTLSHWFDGFSQVYRFQILPQAAPAPPRILFSSRRQVDAQIDQIRRTGRLDGFSFGQKRDPCVGFFGKLKTAFTPPPARTDPHAVNVPVTIHAPVAPSTTPVTSLDCRTDGAFGKTISLDTLEPIGVTDQTKLHRDLSGPLSAAHAQFDPVTGDCYNFNLAFGRFAAYRVFHTEAATGTTTVLATITGSDVPPAYLHSFWLTENYVVLCLWTSRIRAAGMRVLWERNILDAIAPFDPKAECQWYVIDRKQGRGLVGKWRSPAMFSFHTVNAFERKGEDGKTEIVCDLLEYRSLDILHKMYYENLLSTAPGAKEYSAGSPQWETARPSFARYRLAGFRTEGSWKSGDGVGRAERLLQMPMPNAGELPTINGVFSTKEYRFVYGLVDRGKSSFLDGLVKTDVVTQEVIHWNRDKHTPGEAIFIADPERSEKEDGGWLLSVVLDGEKGSSYLLCLDAETMTEVAKADCDQVVGFGFHGTYLANV